MILESSYSDFTLFCVTTPSLDVASCGNRGGFLEEHHLRQWFAEHLLPHKDFYRCINGKVSLSIGKSHCLGAPTPFVLHESSAVVAGIAPPVQGLCSPYHKRLDERC